jgi:hypothetical protein
MVLRSVGVLSCGKIMGILYAVMGLLLGGFFALIALAGAAAPQGQGGGGPDPAAMMAGMGIMAVIVMPIMYGIIGFIGGIIMAAIYNLVAGVVGGLEFDFEQPINLRPMP